MININEIKAYAKKLGLHNLANTEFEFEHFDDTVSNQDYLLGCLKNEFIYRQQKAKDRRIKQAQIPTYKSFDEFDTKFQQGGECKLISVN